MSTLTKLEEWVNENKSKLVIACIGTELRCDDIAGLLVCKYIKQYCNNLVKTIECPGGLELCSHKLLEYKAENLLVVDGVLAGLKPGQVYFTCNVEDLEADIKPVTTHSLPLNTVIKYIKTVHKEIKNICLLGIQVGCLDLGAKPLKEVVESARAVALKICNAIKSTR